MTCYHDVAWRNHQATKKLTQVLLKPIDVEKFAQQLLK